MIVPNPGTTNNAHVMGKGTELDRMVMGLIENAYDKDAETRSVFQKSLISIGHHEPLLVMTSCYSFMLANVKKMSTGHRVILMGVMEQVVSKQNKKFETFFIKDVVKLAVSEMTASKDVVPEWQGAASELLVTLSDHHCEEVMEELVAKFEPGAMPHFFVIQTVANMAVRNAFGMMPFINVVLGHLTTLMMTVKAENLRWVFAHCVAKFCEAIVEYVANIERAPDTTVQKEAFSEQISAVFDVLFNVWMQTKEPKLRAAVIDAISQCVTVMAQERINASVNRLIAGMLGLYKRHQEPYHVSRALANILAVVKEQPDCLGADFDNLFNVLFLQVCVPIDYSNGLSIRNRNELLRCFSLLCQAFPDRVVISLLAKMETSEKTKVAAVAVIRYLVDSCDAALADRKSTLVAGLRTLVNDPSNRVRKELAQVIISMGSHDYLGLEGGETLIEFLVRLCALRKDQTSGGRRATEAGQVTVDELRTMGAMVLRMGSGSVSGMRPVLWPYLLEMVLPEQYTDAVGTVSHAVANILKGDMEGLIMEINYDEMVNLPKPTDLFARLLVLAGRPCGKDLTRCINILELLLLLCPNIHENLEPLCKPVIPKLIQFLTNEENALFEREFDLERWDELMLKMLSKCLEQIEDEDWTVLFGESLASQIPLYEKMPDERSFLYKCMGVVLKHSTKKDFVNKELDVIFSSVRHSNQTEREGCAVCFGLCGSSAVHLDTALAKLKLLHSPESKRSSLLSFIKEKGPGPSGDDKEGARSTIVLALGYCLYYAPKHLLVSRLEADVLKILLPMFKSAKELNFKQNLIKCVELIGRALDPEVFADAYNFDKRNELISYLLGFIRSESVTEMRKETRQLVIKALNYLVRLNPLLTDHEQRDIVTACMDAIFPLPPDGLALKKMKELWSKDMPEAERQERLMQTTLDALTDLMCCLLDRYFTNDTLAELLKAVIPWTVSMHDFERQRSVKTMFEIINSFYNNIDRIVSAPPTLSCVGIILARLTPRVTDPDVTIRALAMDSIQTVLRIQSKFEAGSDTEGDKMVEAIPTLKDRLKKSDSNIMLTAVSDLSKILVRKMPSGHILSFLETLYVGLVDCQSHGSAAACVAMNTLFKVRAQELVHEVGEIMRRLHELIPQMPFEQTRTATLRAVRTVAQHHLTQVVATLTEQALPWAEPWPEMLHAVCMDFSLLRRILLSQLELLSHALPYDERSDPRGKATNMCVATHSHLAAITIMAEVLEPEHVTSAESLLNFLEEHYCRFLLTTLASVASLAGCLTPTGKSYEREGATDARLEANIAPMSIALRLLKHFLTVSESHDLMEEYTQQDFESACANGEWELIVPFIVKSMCETQAGKIPNAVDACVVYLTSPYEPQRILSCFFLAELVSHQCAGHENLIQVVISNLLSRLTDDSRTVRRLALLGMANLAECTIPGVLSSFATTLLSTMMTGMDDRDDPEDEIISVAMDGLARILLHIEEEQVRPILVNICLKIKPSFEKERSSVRAASFRLFGTLSRFGEGPSRASYLDQMEKNLLSVVLHMSDPDDDVAAACTTTLVEMSRLMEDAEETTRLVQERLTGDAAANLHLGEFGHELMKRLIAEQSDKMNGHVMTLISYFRSSWPEIRSAAAMLLGFALGNFTEALRKQVRKEHITSALLNLLKDCEPDVRAKAAEAISRLHQY